MSLSESPGGAGSGPKFEAPTQVQGLQVKTDDTAER
jgi:hypothetical protein